MSKQCKSLAYVLGGSAHTGSHVLPINVMRCDHNHMLSAGRDGAIVLYDADANSKNHIQLHSDWANDLLLYSEATVVSCSSDLSVKWWNYDSGEHGLVGHHADYVKALAKSGNHIVSGGLDKVINVWDVEKCAALQSFANDYGEKGSIYSMASSKSGLIMFGDNVGNVQLFDVRSSQVVSAYQGHKDTVKSIVMGDQKCLSGSSDGTVRLWDLRNKVEPLKLYQNFDGAVWALYSSQEDDFEKDFYTGTSTGTIYHTQQDITKEFGKERRGILSIAQFNGELWSSSMNDSSIKNWNNETKSKKGDAGLIKSRVLNNRRHVVTLSTDDSVVLWDILKCCRVRDFGSDKAFEDVIDELQTSEILPTWCSVTIRAGKLFVVVREASFTNTEVYGNNLDEYGLNLDRDTRYNLGKILIKSIFTGLVEYEIQKDQRVRDARIRELKGSSKLSLLTKFSSHENSPVNTPIEEMKGYFSDTVASRRPSTADSTTAPATAPEQESKDAKDAKDATSSFRRLKLFSRKSSRVSTTLNEEGESENELPTGGSLATLNSLAEQSESAAQVSDSGSKDSSRKSSHTDMDSLASLLAEIKIYYASVTSASSLSVSQITPPTSDEVPVLPLPDDLLIILNECIQNSSAEIDIYSEERSHLHFPTLEPLLAKWIGNFLLRNKTVIKDFPKVGFVVRLHPGSEENLPGVTNGETRLNAYSMLRVRRVLSYITDRLETKTAEITSGQDPEMWLEAMCHGNVLDNNMTLATLRSVIWKQSGDVVITYRRKEKKIR